ncbi:hypothetical protein OCU04_004415 [Sclerotinia nivalis]|uniref:Uncharacterized protein n=1 Tax=Sclerotinia nivalis TaxID=352851 RepID=A0A9X0DLW3_9HELO|nr:hypothetical protein OCU04_004415 [Sclerotinia nivalis]
MQPFKTMLKALYIRIPILPSLYAVQGGFRIVYDDDVYNSDDDDDDDEEMIYGFDILKIDSDIFQVASEGQGARVSLGRLQSSLAGAVLLYEYDGRIRPFYKLFKSYVLREDLLHAFKIEWISGGNVYMVGSLYSSTIRTSIVGSKWSGRLYIAEYRRNYFILFRYVWKDIRNGFVKGLKRFCRK